MPDDCCAGLCDERDDDWVGPVQGFHDVGLFPPAKRAFVERANGAAVSGLLDPDDQVNHAVTPMGSSDWLGH